MSTTGDPSIEGLLQHAAWVNSLARHLAADRDTADDLAQDTWMAALRHPPRGDQPARSWLARVLRNFAHKRVRGDVRRRAREELVARDEGEPSSSSSPDLLERAGIHRDLVAAVMALDEPYRATILLRYFEELAPSQIAARQRVPVSTVKTRLARGLELLRGRLDRKYSDRNAWAKAAWPLAAGSSSTPLVLGALLVKSKLLAAAAVLVATFALVAVFTGDRLSSATRSDLAAIADLQGSTSTTVQDSAAPAGRESAVPIELAPAALPAAGAWAVDTDQDLHGIVVDPEGVGLPDARVEISRNELRGLRLGSEPAVENVVATLSTDAKGRFKSPLPRSRPFDLRVSLAGFAAARIESCHAGEFVQVRLDRGARLHGRVTRRSDSSPLAGAQILATLWDSRNLRDADLETTADADGRYALDGLPSDRLLLSIRHRDAVPIIAMGVRLQAGESRERDFALDEGALASGVVTDAEMGRPIADAEVSLGMSEVNRTRTDAQGRWTLRGLPRDTSFGSSFQARASGYASCWKRVRGVAEAELALDFALARGGLVSGRVIAPDDAPVGGAFVAVHSSVVREGLSGLDRASTSTSADGRFEIHDLDPTAPQVLFVTRDGMGARLYDLPAELATTGSVDLGNIRLGEAATILGRVVDEHGTPLPRTYIYLHGANGDRGAFNGQADYSSGRLFTRREGRCDDRGRFGFTDLSPGRYRLDVSPKGSATVAALELEIGTGEVRRGVELELRIGQTLTGRVVGPEGEPIDTATVEVFREPYDRQRSTYTITDDRGEFRVTGLDEGTYELAFDDDLVTREPGAAELYGGRLKGVRAGASGILFALQSPVEIQGRVVDPEGQPVAGFSVYAIEADRGLEDWPDATARTDASGRFTLRVAPDHAFNVMAATDGFDPDRRLFGSVPGVRSGAKDVVVRIARR